MLKVAALLMVVFLTCSCTSTTVGRSDDVAADSRATRGENATITNADAGGGGAQVATDRVARAVAGGGAPTRKRTPLSAGTGVLVTPKPHSGCAPAAAYPEAARLAGISGEALIRIVVSESGEPLETTIETSSGNELLDAAALDTARRWRFTPASWQGRAVEFDVLVPFIFSLKAPRKPQTAG